MFAVLLVSPRALAVSAHISFSNTHPGLRSDLILASVSAWSPALALVRVLALALAQEIVQW